MVNWILDYATPVSIKDTGAVAPLGYLRNVLVVIKGLDDDTTPTTIFAKPLISISKAVDGLFDGGLPKVSYINRTDLNLSTLELKSQYFTIIFDGFDDVEIASANLGTYDGVVVYEVNTLTSPMLKLTAKVYNPTKDGYTAGYTFGVFLAGVVFANLQYYSTSKNISYVESLGQANTAFESRLICWGRDDSQGQRLISAFVGGKGLATPYVEEEIKVNLQANNLKMLAGGLAYTLVDTAVVKNTNTNYIQQFYVDTGLVQEFTYNVALSSDTTAFLSELNLTTTMPIWKIKMEVIV